MIKLDHPIVIIFGAGASRGGLDKISELPPPVDKDFFDIANQLTGHGTPTLAKKVLNDVWQLYSKTNDVDWRLITGTWKLVLLSVSLQRPPINQRIGASVRRS
jgi:hypothetical protein